MRSAASLRLLPIHPFGFTVALCTLLAVRVLGGHEQSPAWTDRSATEAADELLLRVLANCEYDFAITGGVTSPNLTFQIKGRCGFYHCGGTLIIDTDVRHVERTSQGASQPEVQFFRQGVIRPTHPGIMIEYARPGPRTPLIGTTTETSGKKLINIWTNSGLEKNEQISRTLEYSRLGHVLGFFSHTDLSLAEVAHRSAVAAVISADTRIVTAKTQTKYGDITVVYTQMRNHYLIRV